MPVWALQPRARTCQHEAARDRQMHTTQEDDDDEAGPERTTDERLPQEVTHCLAILPRRFRCTLGPDFWPGCHYNREGLTADWNVTRGATHDPDQASQDDNRTRDVPGVHDGDDGRARLVDELGARS